MADKKTMSDYCQIGNMVSVGRTGKTFAGPVIASDQAIYVVVDRDSATEQFNAGYRGVAGITSKMDGLIQSIPVAGLDAFTTDQSTLAETVGRDETWPIALGEGPAYRFPREQVQRMTFGLMTGLTFKADGVPVCIYGKGQHTRDAKAFLPAHGWPLDTRGFLARLFNRDVAA